MLQLSAVATYPPVRPPKAISREDLPEHIQKVKTLAKIDSKENVKGMVCWVVSSVVANKEDGAKFLLQSTL